MSRPATRAYRMSSLPDPGDVLHGAARVAPGIVHMKNESTVMKISLYAVGPVVGFAAFLLAVLSLCAMTVSAAVAKGWRLLARAARSLPPQPDALSQASWVTVSWASPVARDRAANPSFRLNRE